MSKLPAVPLHDFFWDFCESFISAGAVGSIGILRKRPRRVGRWEVSLASGQIVCEMMFSRAPRSTSPSYPRRRQARPLHRIRVPAAGHRDGFGPPAGGGLVQAFKGRRPARLGLVRLSPSGPSSSPSPLWIYERWVRGSEEQGVRSEGQKEA